MPDRFAFYLYARELPELLSAVNTEEGSLRRGGHTLLADKLLKAYGQLRKDLDYLSATVAGAGTLKLVEKERSTRVRPDSLGNGGPRLESFLHCDPLPQVPGSVGVANEDTLDAGVPWWPTNEEGSSARVGGHIFGQFFGAGLGGGGAAPNPAQAGVHPLFQAEVGPGSGPGVIQQPIPARHFIRDAIPEIEAQWLRGFAAAKGKFDATLAEIYTTLAVERRGVKV